MLHQHETIGRGGGGGSENIGREDGARVDLLGTDGRRKACNLFFSFNPAKGQWRYGEAQTVQYGQGGYGGGPIMRLAR